MRSWRACLRTRYSLKSKLRMASCRYRTPPWTIFVDALEAPLAKSPASSCTVFRPRSCASRAQPEPVAPPPITHTSKLFPSIARRASSRLFIPWDFPDNFRLCRAELARQTGGKAHGLIATVNSEKARLTFFSSRKAGRARARVKSRCVRKPAEMRDQAFVPSTDIPPAPSFQQHSSENRGPGVLSKDPGWVARWSRKPPPCRRVETMLDRPSCNRREAFHIRWTVWCQNNPSTGNPCSRLRGAPWDPEFWPQSLAKYLRSVEYLLPARWAQFFPRKFCGTKQTAGGGSG